MRNLQKTGGIAALSEAIIYLSAFIFFGAFWHYPTGADVAQKLAFLSDKQVTLSIVNFIIYVLFGILLAILVLALHERIKDKALSLSQLASVFGIIWVGLVIASGMVKNIGLETVINLSIQDPEQAMTVWIAISAITEGLGGGNEIVGGFWVLLISIAALKANELPKMLNFLGLLVGTAGILTVFSADILTEVFGISQIVWFIWLGFVMLKKPSN